MDSHRNFYASCQLKDHTKITLHSDWKLQQQFGNCIYSMNIKRENNSFFNRLLSSRKIWDTAHKKEMNRFHAAPLYGAQFYY
jgi:hypothetical protein